MGLHYSEVMDHVMEHLQRYWTGDRSEDHLAKASWGLLALMYYDAHAMGYTYDDWTMATRETGIEGVETFDAKVAQSQSEHDLSR